MLAIYQDGDEVIICEVGKDGKPKTGCFFKKDTGRHVEEMNFSLVEAPILITRGDLECEPERTLIS